jgi:hypothetical protein
VELPEKSCPKAGISKNYCAKYSGSPEVELKVLSMDHIFQILNWVA